MKYTASRPVDADEVLKTRTTSGGRLGAERKRNRNNFHLFGNKFPAKSKREYHGVIRGRHSAMGKRMAKTAKVRPWTKEDVRTLKALAREKTKTTAIAHKLKRS